MNNRSGEQKTMAVAVFDIETSPQAPDSPVNAEDLRFLCGVVRWLRVVQWKKTPTSVASYSVGTMAQNVYWDPAAMVDDLLRPWAHAIMAWRGASFDVPVLAAQAAGPAVGPFMNDPSDADVVAVSRHLRAWGHPTPDYPLVRITKRTRRAEPRNWVQELIAGWRTHRLQSRWLSNKEEAAVARHCTLHAEYSEIRGPGLVSLMGGRGVLQKRLMDRLFDPHEWMEVRSGSTVNPCHLDWLRAGLAGPSGAPPAWTMPDGSEPDKGGFEAHWDNGHIWDVIDCCQHDVDLLSQILHVGLHGHLTTNQLNGEARDMWRNDRTGSTWKYAIDTKSWWALLTGIRSRA